MSEKLKLNQHYIYLTVGLLFFLVYWYWGYDGITFSDDTAYITYGHQMWLKTTLMPDDNFTFRWGAYLLSGLITYLFGFDDHLASISSLIYYAATLLLIWSILPKRSHQIWFVLFFVSNIYLLHFLTKVYPDAALVFWTSLIPFAAYHRHKAPLKGALLMSLAFFIGFCTKETIVYLAPFPVLLLFFDMKQQNSKTFYYYFFSFILLLLILYLGYFQWKFGNPFYRFQSIQESHYVSPYSFFDKGWPMMLERLTIIPFTTSVERAYWIWIVLAAPSMVRAFMTKKDIQIVFSLTSLCLILGFWFMSTSFTYYNPLHLNPRHLIILVPFLSVNIAMESYRWQGHFFWNRFCSLWIAFGGVMALAMLNWKMGVYYFLFAGVLFFLKNTKRFTAIIILLLIPVIVSVHYQKNLKNYSHFKSKFIHSLQNSGPDTPLITHKFVQKSQEVILGKRATSAKAVDFEEFKKTVLNHPPEHFTLFLYSYSHHAYPDEADLLERVNEFAYHHQYILSESIEDPWVQVLHFQKVNPLSPNSYRELAMTDSLIFLPIDGAFRHLVPYVSEKDGYKTIK